MSTPPLRILSHRVASVAVGATTQYVDGMLTVSAVDAQAAFANPALAAVRITWASPGDSVRIIKVLDVVEPRTKGGPDGGGIFPGFLPVSSAPGTGDTHVLPGVAVMTAGYLPRAQEGLIEMSGPGADLTPFGRTRNLVVEFTPARGASWEAVDAALRLGLLRLAARLAGAATNVPPDEVRVLPSFAARMGDSLPRIGAVTNVQTQGAFKDVFVYGKSFSGASPTLIDPNELEDGAVVSGQFGHPALKNPTYLHQNHPVVAELRRRDGVDLAFAGLVLSPEPVDQSGKEKISAQAARLCAELGMQGVVITKEGGGNADADVSLKMDALADLGIETVGLFAEMAGPDGTAPPLVVPPERATGMVSVANYDEIVALPAVNQALGGDTLDVLNASATAAVQAPTAVLYCALSPLGAGYLTCRDLAHPGPPARGQP